MKPLVAVVLCLATGHAGGHAAANLLRQGRVAARPDEPVLAGRSAFWADRPGGPPKLYAKAEAAALQVSSDAAAEASPVERGLQPPRLITRDVYLMGTRAHLSTYASTREKGLTTLESALSVLEETERELSTWRDDSEISVLNRRRVGEPWQATPRLCRMFAAVYDWHHATAGAFDPAIGRLLAAWDIHGDGTVPTSETLAGARALSGLPLLSFNRSRCTVTRRANVTLDVGAFGKGEALDRVEAALGDEPWMIDLGGQISVGGRVPGGAGWPIAVAHPLERDRPFLHVRIANGSLSTSAGSERDRVVNGRRVGHILDPRTGEPAPFSGSVTVWHRQGLAADALSTALYVLGPEDGLRWAEARGLAVCYLIPEGEGVRMVTTSAFRGLFAETGHRGAETQSLCHLRI